MSLARFADLLWIEAVYTRGPLDEPPRRWLRRLWSFEREYILPD